jgi:hypothetical protein
LLDIDEDHIEAGGLRDPCYLDAAHKAHSHRGHHLAPLELFFHVVAHDVARSHGIRPSITPWFNYGRLATAQ